MNTGTIFILTLLISAAVCQDETDGNGKQDKRGAVRDAAIGVGVIVAIVIGSVFFVICCAVAAICWLPYCMCGSVC